MLKTLVVDDDAILRFTVRSTLEAKGYKVFEADKGETAINIVKEHGPFEAVFLDVNMPGMSGIEALAEIKAIHPQTFCLIMTAYSNLDDAKQALKLGAYDYLEKPVDGEKLVQILEESKSASQMVQQASFSAPELSFDAGRKIIGNSDSIQKVFDIIYKLSRVDTSVLVRGESGTGKELVARALHYNSSRKNGPFVALNLSALPENLIESELFGHEKGSFTGADKKKIGKLQHASGGTLFLDEIGDISSSMQVKLLRILQEKKYTPVGSNQELTADVRIVTATHRNLEDMIEKGEFRSDLFYRLNVLPINLPALRERKSDIESLCSFLISKFNKIHGREIKSVSEAALAKLKAYNWPGNIRELENVIEHCFIIESTDEITESSIPANVTENKETGSPNIISASNSSSVYDLNDVSSDELKFPVLKEQFEKDFILRALKAFDGRINKTAQHTEMTKVTLLRKLEKYQIDPKQFHI